jgi:DNA-binding NarL/FixJ family response regulator
VAEGPIDVLLAEDHTIVREGLRALLAARQDVRVVGEAADGEEAVALATRLRPHVVVMDLTMPRLDGVAATRAIRDALPDTRVLVLSMHSGEEHVRPALRAGATGYLVKGSGLSDLVTAIRAVAEGKTFLSPEAAAVVATERTGARGAELTPRERDVLDLVVAGRTSVQIGEALGIGVKTVEGHRSNLMQKIGAANAAELVREALKRGLAR